MFHLAAQSLVIESFKDPKMTFESNVIGAENILNMLEIPYRVVCLSSADLGFSANKT